MDKMEETIRTKSKFLISTLKKSKQINEMDLKELWMLAGKANHIKIYSELLDDESGVKYWETVYKVCKERLLEINPEESKIKFYSTPKEV